MRVSSITKNAGKACNNRLYRHIRTFEKIIKNYFVIYVKNWTSKAVPLSQAFAVLSDMMDDENNTTNKKFDA